MMTTALTRTPLHDWHVAHGGRMVDFAGWSMPVQYSSIVEEHNATRNAVGVFDISHMGRLQFRGSGVLQFVDSVLTRRIADIKPRQIRYSLICNNQGGILDDVLFYDAEPEQHELVVNASNREKIVAWLRERLPDSIDLVDRTRQTAMIAVQGPRAIEAIQPLIGGASSIATMRYYTSADATFQDVDILVSRTGYTGEDGVEIVCSADAGRKVWDAVIKAVKPIGGIACGLGARDTLRLEAAMPLYGHELSETINPIQAGLNFAVNLEHRKFIGSEALARFAADKSQPIRVGLELEGKRVAREGCPVFRGDDIVGEVTSGTFSPTLQRSIAMAYVKPTAQSVGTQLTVDIRGRQYPAVVVQLPFYKRQK
jgi:aminomethyltransferase